MTPKYLRQLEQRLAALTYDDSPCRAFRIEPQGSSVERWNHISPGPNGEKFLHHWLTGLQRRQLRELGTTTISQGVWQLALNFGEPVWSVYTLRAMGVSDLSGARWPLDEPLKRWPEGVRLCPTEERWALATYTDLLGVALPVNGWTVACFIFNEYGEAELRRLIAQFDAGTLDPAEYLANPSARLGLPRPVLTVDYPPGCPVDEINYLPPQHHIDLHPHNPHEKRLFQEHWVMRVLNPPEKEETL